MAAAAGNLLFLFFGEARERGIYSTQRIVTLIVKNRLAQNSKTHADGIFFYGGINNILQTRRINTREGFF